MQLTAIIKEGENGWLVGQIEEIPTVISQGKTFKFFSFLLLFLIIIYPNSIICQTTNAQKYDIAMGFFITTQIKYEPTYKTEIDSINALMLKARKNLIHRQKENEENITSAIEKAYQEEMLKLYKILSIDQLMATNIMLSLRDFLLEGLHEDSVWVVPVFNKVSEQHKELKKIANAQSLRYLLGIPNISIRNAAIETKSFLYDDKLNKILFQKTFRTKILFTKKESRFKNIEKAFEKSIELIKKEIATNIQIRQDIPNFQNPKIIEELRYEYLDKLYLKKPDEEIFKIIRSDSTNKKYWDSKSDSLELYQGFFNDDKTQLIAFYIKKEEWKRSNEGAIPDKSQYISNETTKRVYKFKAVGGVLYKNKWYLTSTDLGRWSPFLEIDEKDMDSLKKEIYKKDYFKIFLNKCFFQPRTPIPSPDFWNLNFFEKIEDNTDKIQKLRKQVSIEDNVVKKDSLISILIEFEKMKKYVGGFEFVYKVLDWEDSDKHNDIFYVDCVEKLVDPIFQASNKKNALINDFHIQHNWKLLFSTDWNYFILPYWQIQDEKKYSLKFMVFDIQKNKSYYWTYLSPLPLDSQKMQFYGTEDEKEREFFRNYFEEMVYKALSKIPACILGMILKDQCFWDEYIFKQKDGKFQYLNEIN